MAFEFIKVDRDGPITTFTLNRPDWARPKALDRCTENLGGGLNLGLEMGLSGILGIKRLGRLTGVLAGMLSRVDTCKKCRTDDFSAA